MPEALSRKMQHCHKFSDLSMDVEEFYEATNETWCENEKFAVMCNCGFMFGLFFLLYMNKGSENYTRTGFGTL